jgi:hypothetical protein
MTSIYQFPTPWYQFTRRKFNLVSVSQVTAMPLYGIKRTARGVAQLWRADLTMTEQEDPDRQEIEAFFHRLDGQAGAIRIGDPTRRTPWYNRNVAATRRTFSDGTSFTDGTGFADGLLPPFVTALEAATKGASFVKMAGFPASVANALTRGDLFEHRPNGIHAGFPCLYEIMHGNSTDAAGQAGVEIRPRLRAGIAAGDQIVFDEPTTVMRLADDNQGEIEVTPPVIGNGSFVLAEALDMVP